MTRLGVDVGDTFTDLIFHDDETEVRVSTSEEAARRAYPHAFDP